MNPPRLLLFALALALPLPAQTVTKTSLRDSGQRENRPNLVFVGEGYTATESGKFVTDATAKLNALLANEAFSPFASLINADALFVASNQSGADDPATNTVVDTYFNSSFNDAGIDRLLGIDSDGSFKLLVALVENTPDYDLVILLVNSTKSGGSGGFPTISSLGPDSDEIVLHELGHSFAKLGDEYEDAAFAAATTPREFPNATAQAAPGLVAWHAFIQPGPVPTTTAPDENTVGVFPGAYYRSTGYYRPTYNSKMRTLGRPFGPVNLRAFANGIHRLNLYSAMTPPVITQQPLGTTVAAGQALTLGVTASGLGPFTYQWRFNSVYIINATAPTLTIAAMSAAQAGVYSVEVTNSFDTVTSAGAVVTVTAPPPVYAAPTILVQPVSAMLAVGSTATFTVTATGSPAPTYQWQKNGVNLTNGGNVAGATSPTLTLTGITQADWGNYAVVVTNVLGSTLSNNATLTVMVPVSAPTGASVTIQVR